MASAHQSDEENPSESESEESDSEEQSEEEDSDCQDFGKQPCKYYNSGGCRDGQRCSYLHVCKYALKGNCRYGSSYPKLTDGRYYQWQLNDGNTWMDVDNDHIIEAQYSLPHTRSIKIYNTPYGAVCIDFNRMKVFGKSLRVRRLDDGNTEWIWYCTLGRKWIKYGDKDSKGKPTPVKSADIEKKFQSNSNSSFTFHVGAETFEIRFNDMRQVGKKKKRKVTRRPLYRQQAGAAVSQATAAVQNLSLNTTPQWQFEGNSGTWHVFKYRRGTRSECSVNSEDIERMYQQNQQGSMTFKVKNNSYNLDFGVFYNHNTENGWDSSQEATVSGKHYEWQLLVGPQWLRIDHDHVIETHYCQPGAKGITINTNQGQVFIDFDKLQTLNPAMKVHRLTFFPSGQTEDVGWYFRDDQLWREYGSQSSGLLPSSVSSSDVEHQFTLNPQGNFTFMVGSTSYRLDFSTMTQINCTTGLRRNVRRRPKLKSNTDSLYATTQLADGGYKWEFMGEEGQWTEYAAHVCSLDSAAIERQYQLNPQGQLHFKTKKFTYTLDFSRMYQVNDTVGTQRAVRRTANNGSQQISSGGAQPRWQFKDIGGIWRDYTNRHQCNISSQDIELQYQQNPSGTMMFTTNNFNYELNFSAMTQRNLSTNTTRQVRRLNQ
ncbi:hypothetical protein L3Q82_009390 [Scortum barcoo]|uniref:Uncharacterized protein n=1 Tax=Scortum barcoo TaxID=214431 RepID=A0ACB8WFT3_9TELE|nr:hypothetical protein L3Q82_009390 [Scortum barcoo]